MVHTNSTFIVDTKNQFDTTYWLNHLETKSPQVEQALELVKLSGEDCRLNESDTCFSYSLKLALLIKNLNLGEEVLAAALLYPALEHTELTLDDLTDSINTSTIQLLHAALSLHDITTLQHPAHSNRQLDNVRKMLLAMVSDVRVVVLKLADRLILMRSSHEDQSSGEQTRLAKETLNIYAPLASRLGITDLKWELEDLAFSFLEADCYKSLAKQLQERRLDREQRVTDIINTLEKNIAKENIKADIQGRAKHIYSIHRKMQRKNVNFDHIFDAIAVRVLVDTEEECYKVLGLVHQLWSPIPEEFDDYISTPKSNGYRSIHSAVNTEDGKHFEIQIRTHQMHHESEVGVAAHWLYKEGGKVSSFEEKIKWLRDLLEWQKEVSEDTQLPEQLEKNIFTDRIYVFTPLGEIIDLPINSTPLDFAYHIHTELGHRCRGAKIKGRLVSLNTQLSMGDTIEIVTAKNATPSRDWLIPQNQYVKTSRARAKIMNYFKKHDRENHIKLGQEALERELKRMNITMPNLDKYAVSLGYKSGQDILAALSTSDLKLQTLINHIQPNETEEKSESTSITDTKIRNIKPKQSHQHPDISIDGESDLMMHIAKCCKPLPGDPVIGYITQGQGITVHHTNCSNILHIDEDHTDRLIDVNWLNEQTTNYWVDFKITVNDRSGLINDITHLLSQLKINIIKCTTSLDRKKKQGYIILTIETPNVNEAEAVVKKLQQIPDIHEVSRQSF